MRNAKQYPTVSLFKRSIPPRGSDWCTCKFWRIRSRIISAACHVIEALQCKCERPMWTEEDEINWLRQHGFIEDQLTDEEREARYQRDLKEIQDEQRRDQI